MPVTVIGAGLAGCEAAFQLAQEGIEVRLLEMKPRVRTPAQASDCYGELVCSNSLRSANPSNAVGLLKEEMRRLGSLVIRCADATRVPAGDALAVDREAFAAAVTATMREHAQIEVVTGVVDRLPESGDVIVATGPLTHEALARDIVRLTGQERLYFYDAIAPIVTGDSINRDVVFAGSRYGKGGGDDYLNCPLDERQYEAFVDEVLAAQTTPLHGFETPQYFPGCLPIEVLAAGGRDTLRYGTMKPVGLTDPRTGRRAYAVLQLRMEDPDGQAWNLVGFQTKMTIPEQRRVFRSVPGLEHVEFLRYGAVHRNTFLDSPSLLDERMRLRARPNVRFAGQITGVEGYVESAAHGLVTALLLAAELRGEPARLPPEETALGALFRHVTGTRRLENRPHEPQNVNWGLFPLPPGRKKDRKQARVERARTALDAWLSERSAA